MSNFTCEKCDAKILEGPNGHYITEYEHYPIDKGSNKMEEVKDYKVTHEFFIAGVQFHDYKSVEKDMVEGDNLSLVPEPTNKFDPNAVQIKFRDTFIGFVPKKFSSEVSAASEIGKELRCVLVELNKDAKPWEKFKVEIRELNDFFKAGPDVGDGPDYDEGCREE